MQTKVKTTYMELRDRDEFKPKKGFRQRLEVREVENDAYLNFILFAGVGLPWRWSSRLRWTPDEWAGYFSSQQVFTWLGFESKKLIGYFEIEFDRQMDAEIKFFGVFPGYMGRGLGGMLLSHAIECAWSKGAKRVWLHTCSNDSEAAIGNYLARGFKVFKEEEKSEHVPETTELIALSAKFFENYIKRFSPDKRK